MLKKLNIKVLFTAVLNCVDIEKVPVRSFTALLYYIGYKAKLGITVMSGYFAPMRGIFRPYGNHIHGDPEIDVQPEPG